MEMGYCSCRFRRIRRDFFILFNYAINTVYFNKFELYNDFNIYSSLQDTQIIRKLIKFINRSFLRLLGMSDGNMINDNASKNTKVI